MLTTSSSGDRQEGLFLLLDEDLSKAQEGDQMLAAAAVPRGDAGRLCTLVSGPPHPTPTNTGNAHIHSFKINVRNPECLKQKINKRAV